MAETPSVNTRYWRRVGYLSAVPNGVVFTVPQAPSTGGELILVQNWLNTLPELFEEN